MSRHKKIANLIVEAPAVERQPRCQCCDGVLSDVSERATAVGLNLSLGLVSDECALICNDCTAKLIEARASRADAPRKSR